MLCVCGRQTGMRQHFLLGRYLRDRYINGNPYRLLSANYTRTEVLYLIIFVGLF